MSASLQQLRHYVLSVGLETEARLERQNPPKASSNASGTVVVLPYYREPYSVWNYAPTTITNIVIDTRSPAERREEREENKRNVAILIGAVVVLAGAFFAGITLGKWLHTANTLNDAKCMQSAARKYELNTVVAFIDLKKDIASLDASKHRAYFLAVVVALIGGGLLLGGGFGAIPALMTAGYLTLLSSGVLILGNAGMHYNDDEVIERKSRGMLHRATASESLMQRALLEIDRRTAVDDPPPPYDLGYDANHAYPIIEKMGSALADLPPPYGATEPQPSAPPQ